MCLCICRKSCLKGTKGQKSVQKGTLGNKITVKTAQTGIKGLWKLLTKEQKWWKMLKKNKSKLEFPNFQKLLLIIMTWFKYKDFLVYLITSLENIMVLILVNNSEIGVHVGINLFYLICLRYFIKSRAVTNRIFFIRKDLYSFMRAQAQAKYVKTFFWDILLL